MDALSKIFDDIHLNKAEYIYLKAKGDWCFQMPQQNAVVAHIILNGRLHLQYEQQTIIANAGDIVLIPAGLMHTASNTLPLPLVAATDLSELFAGHRNEPFILGHETQENDQELFCLSFRSHIDMAMAGPLIQALPSVMHIQSLLTSRSPEWLQIGLMFVGIETQNTRPGRDKILDHLVSILFIECVRDFICNLSDQSNWLNALTHPEISQALAAIHGEPQLAWTVESLAERSCMSRSKFASLFHSVVGEPPLAYLQQHRLRLASQLLRESNFNIQQIANRVGYASETAFSQAFKRQYGVSPTQHRQHHLKSE